MTEHEQNLVVVFVDISGSTRLFAEHGNALALELINQCMETLKQIIEQYQGRVVQTFGDGILCTFTSVDQAFVAGQAFCRSHHDQEVSIHAGIHSGKVIVQADTIYGNAVNVASRIADIAGEQEVILSERVRDKLALEYQYNTRALSNRTFVKGKREPIKLFKMLFEDTLENTALLQQVVIPDLHGIQLQLRYKDQEIILQELSSDFVMGRLADCNLAVQDHYASRRHATIDCKPGKFTLQDHSSNGTYIQSQDSLVALNRDSMQLYGSGIISLGISLERNPEHRITYQIVKVGV